MNLVNLKYMKSIEFNQINDYKFKHSKDNYTTITNIDNLLNYFYDSLSNNQIDAETISNYKSTFNKYFLSVCVNASSLSDCFSYHTMDNFKSNLKNADLKTSTINNKLSMMRKLIIFARKRGLINIEIAQNCLDILEPVKIINNRIENNYLENDYEDFNKFIKTFENTDHDFLIPILTLFYGALRIGEWQALKVCDFDFKNSKIKINKQIDNHNKVKTKLKNGQARIIDMPESFMKEINDYFTKNEKFENDYAFSKNSNPINRSKIRNLLSEHLKMSGLKYITPHGLRHSFATRMFDKGYSVKEVQQHLGHLSMQTTMKYYIHYVKKKEKKNLEDLI